MITAFVIATLSQAVPLMDMSKLSAGVPYPPAALRNRETGTVRYELDIGPMGEVIGCTILQSSGSAILDQTSCETVRRARFEPPKNSDPESAKYRGGVAWQMEDQHGADKVIVFVLRELPLNLLIPRTLIRHAIDARGRVRDCTITDSSGSAKLDEFACRMVSKKARFKPPTAPLRPQTMAIEWRQSPQGSSEAPS